MLDRYLSTSVSGYGPALKRFFLVVRLSLLFMLVQCRKCVIILKIIYLAFISSFVDRCLIYISFFLIVCLLMAPLLQLVVLISMHTLVIHRYLPQLLVSFLLSTTTRTKLLFELQRLLFLVSCLVLVMVLPRFPSWSKFTPTSSVFCFT